MEIYILKMKEILIKNFTYFKQFVLANTQKIRIELKIIRHIYMFKNKIVYNFSYTT